MSLLSFDERTGSTGLTHIVQWPSHIAQSLYATWRESRNKRILQSLSYEQLKDIGFPSSQGATDERKL
jgi:uncharacterized protein YjiS (DUF1127 family)